MWGWRGAIEQPVRLRAPLHAWVALAVVTDVAQTASGNQHISVKLESGHSHVNMFSFCRWTGGWLGQFVAALMSKCSVEGIETGHLQSDGIVEVPSWPHLTSSLPSGLASRMPMLTNLGGWPGKVLPSAPVGASSSMYQPLTQGCEASFTWNTTCRQHRG